MQKGTLLVISGFSGGGKGTVVRGLQNTFDHYVLSVSCTTRAPRPGETEGKDYFFVTQNAFEKMIAEKQLIEYATYVGNYYGTPRSFVEEQLNAGKNVILEIEVQGAMKVRRAYPEALLIFLVPPTVEELYRRLKNRGTESEEKINSRMRQAVEESEFIDEYDYLVVNDDLEKCILEIDGLIMREKLRVSRQEEFVKQIQDVLKEQWKGV